MYYDLLGVSLQDGSGGLQGLLMEFTIPLPAVSPVGSSSGFVPEESSGLGSLHPELSGKLLNGYQVVLVLLHLGSTGLLGLGFLTLVEGVLSLLVLPKKLLPR